LPAGPLVILARAWGATLLVDGFLAYGPFFHRLLRTTVDAWGQPAESVEGVIGEMLLATAFVSALFAVESWARRARKVAAPAGVARIVASVAIAAPSSELRVLPALGGGAIVALALLSGEIAGREKPASR